MKRSVLFLILFLCSYCSLAEIYTQTIRGVVLDAQTREPLVGAVVSLADLEPVRTTTTNGEGKFVLQEVPLGRYDVVVTYLGYRPWEVRGILLQSGKEFYLRVEMEELVTELESVQITYAQRKDIPANEFALASARAFTIAETERYAGSLGDPSRMVANYAGVLSVSDARNDIIIRGNSPNGVLWRLEGIDIPSPNHYSSDGLTGGPVSMLSANHLAQSDFFTGAFPAMYGNALAGAFDLKLRNGNPERYEFVGQIGWGGFELGAEGPLSKKHAASFLVGYRYSVLGLLDRIGLHFNVGTGTAVPYYQDLTFKVNVPINSRITFALFGLGGLNSIFFKWDKRNAQSDQPTNSDLDFATQLGVLGTKFTCRITENARLIFKLAGTIHNARTQIDSLAADRSKKWSWYTREIGRYVPALYADYEQRISSKHYLEVGISTAWNRLKVQDSVLIANNTYYHSIDAGGDYFLTQGNIAWRYRPTNALTMSSGAHGLYLHLNNTWTIEPRIGVQWQFAARQILSVALGLHSQMQPPLYYFLKTRNTNVTSLHNLDLSRAFHAVLAYDFRLTKDIRLKTELYYQWLYAIPVSEGAIPTLSILDFGDTYYTSIPRDLRNEGNGRNYGVELTLEKFLAGGYYFLFTGSLFQSEVRAHDRRWRNAKFNGQYAFNILAGYEYAFNQQHIVLADVRAVYAGGKWFNRINESASAAANELIEDWAQPFVEKAPPYFNLNVRLAYRQNLKRVAQEWALDLQNVTNQANIYNKSWDRTNKRVTYRYQQGFMPMFNYRILF